MVRNCVERPSIYRRNLETLDVILAIHVDVEIPLGFTFQNRAAQILLLHVFAEIPLLYVTMNVSWYIFKYLKIILNPLEKELKELKELKLLILIEQVKHLPFRIYFRHFSLSF